MQQPTKSDSQQLSADAWLHTQSQVVEQPFASETPVVGGLIAWLRTRWNNIAARWYVQGLFQQQNQFNATVAKQMINQNTRLTAQDQDIVRLTKTVAELELHIKQLSQQFADTEAKVEG